MQRIINVFVFGPGILDKGVKKLAEEERIDAPRWERILAKVKTEVMTFELVLEWDVRLRFALLPYPVLSTTSYPRSPLLHSN
jgi:hypothetical protein